MNYNPEENMHKLEVLGRLAGGIAHDFNNILSIIEGYTHIAVKQLREGKLTEDQLLRVLKSTQRGAALTRQLLAFGRQKILLDEVIDFGDAIRQQEILLRPLLGEKVALVLDLPHQPVYINAAMEHVTQIVMNLAINAEEAMPEGGRFLLGLKALPGNQVLLRAEDTGHGMEPDVQRKIFDPFFTTKRQGTGLGLSAVYGLVSQLRGTIKVFSAPGEGARFEIMIPVANSVPDEIIEASEASMLYGKTILLAEDEDELRGVMTELLSGLNMKVLPAANGSQALVIQENYGGKIDFLLTDVVMPEMNGVRLAHEFARIRPESNVVYMSGYPFHNNRSEFDLPENAMLLSKPINEEKLANILRRALEIRDDRAKDE